MDKPTYRLWAERTVQAVENILPEVDHRTRECYERCLPHPLGCTQLIEQLELTSSGAILLYRTATYLCLHARYAEAEPLYQGALHIIRQKLGPESSQVADLLNALAELYREQGKYAQAEPLYQRALYIWEQTPGPEYPNVAFPLCNLANLYAQQGKYAEAEPLYQRALHIWEQALGPEHPQVALPLNNLAHLYQQQGKDADAKPLYHQSLHITEHSI